MSTNASIRFFDTQFRKQLRDADLQLNPFEQAALPYLNGQVLDFGCGLGNLSVAAAQRGCTVLALDASPTAVAHLTRIAGEQGLSITAAKADLSSYEITGEFDTVVAIGLLMFFDCAAARRQLESLQAHTRPGGVTIVNTLIEGTTYLDMFDPAGYCLFPRDEIPARFRGWQILHCEYRDFPAPTGQIKSFVTVIARKPQ